MNIGHAHLVGVDDDLVDQLDQLVVGRGGDIIADGAFTIHLAFIEGGQQIADGTVIGIAGNAGGAEQQVEGQRELVVGGHPVLDLAARENVVDDARTLDLLGIQADHHDAFGTFLHRRPFALVEELALEVLQQVGGLDTV